jgi:hypothetical protein
MAGLNSTTEPQARVCPPTPFVSSTFINHPERSSDQFTVVMGLGYLNSWYALRAPFSND